MKRISVTLAAMACIVMAAFAWPVPVKDGTEDRNHQLMDFLRNPIQKFQGYDDPKTTLQEALQDLMDRYDVTFDIDEKAFKDAQVPDVLLTLIAEKPIRPISNVQFSRVLRKILAPLPAESGATFYVQNGAIMITTRKGLRAMCRVPEGRELMPLVHGNFDKRILEDALGELAARADMNIVIDQRCAEKARLPITAKFSNVPVDTAARALADMADLKSVMLDNVIYVTSKENAERLQAEEDKKAVAKSKDAPDKMPAAK